MFTNFDMNESSKQHSVRRNMSDSSQNFFFFEGIHGWWIDFNFLIKID